MKTPERQRTLPLLAGLVGKLEEKLAAQAACFWSQEALSPFKPELRDQFLDELGILQPASGYQRKPGHALPMMDGEEVVKEILALDGPLDASKYQHFLSYWCTAALPGPFIQKYFGHGFASVLLLAKAAGPPPMPLPPFLAKHPGFQPLLEGSSPEALARKTAAAAHPFNKQSVQLFGEGFVRPAWLPHLPFLLPELCVADFFTHGEKLAKPLFALTPVYLRESVADQGVLIASKEPLHELLIELLAGKAAR